MSNYTLTSFTTTDDPDDSTTDDTAATTDQMTDDHTTTTTTLPPLDTTSTDSTANCRPLQESTPDRPREGDPMDGSPDYESEATTATMGRDPPATTRTGTDASAAGNTTQHNDPLDAAARHNIDACRRLGLDANVESKLRREYNLDETDLQLLAATAEATRGERYRTMDGDTTWCLLDDMREFYGSYVDRVHRLEQQGLLEAIHKWDPDDPTDGNPRRYNNYHYWRLAGDAHLLIDDDYTADLGESWLHQQTIALFRTYTHLHHDTLGIPYGPVDADGNTADLVVPLNVANRTHFNHRVPGSAPDVAVEMMRDHNNTQHVIDRFRVYENAAGIDTIWVCENVPTANQWLRRLQDHGVMEFARDYTWHRKTALDTIKTRVEAANYRGMRTVTTVHGLVNWFNHGTEHFEAHLRAAHNNRTTIPSLTLD